MHRLFRQMRWAAPHLRVAAIEGESGTGKTLAAETLHRLGPGSARAFVPCLATVFFAEPRQPRLDEARGGMLYLHHIDDLDPEQQLRLSELLNWFEHAHHPGSSAQTPLQILVSSIEPLRRLAATGHMQAGLSHHLTAIRLVVPPLRHRREDIPLLAQHFLDEFSREYHKPVRGLGPGSLGPLLRYNWPGNVRELASVLRAAALSIDGQWVRPIDLPSFEALDINPPHGADSAGSDDPAGPQSASTSHATASGVVPLTEDLSLSAAVHRHIASVLVRTNGNKLRAARLLRISRSTLYRILANPNFPVA
jgi:DNA-binding NtrC family response regulator